MTGRELEVERIAAALAQVNFPQVAAAIRARSASIRRVWRDRSVAAMPHLDRLTVNELENSIAMVVGALATAMEGADADRLREIIIQSPAYGVASFHHKCSLQDLLAQESILRSVIVTELRDELGRPLTTPEAACLHDLLDLMGRYSFLAMIQERDRAADVDIQRQISGMHRLAELGTLVAGVAHDASNFLLPLRIRLEHLRLGDLPATSKEDVESISLIIDQIQNSIVNLRWLTVDTTRAPGTGPPLHLHDWARGVAAFHKRMLLRGITIAFDVPAPPHLPPVGITSAALSQAVFNLIHNAQQAIMSDRAKGHIHVSAALRAEGGVDLLIEDDGPGMSPEVLKRCTEAFFSTRPSGSGLGLSLVHALVAGCGGKVSFRSPPPLKDRGTVAILSLPMPR